MYLLVLFLVTFAFPTVILIFTYGSIAIVLKRQVTPGNANDARDKAIFNTKVKVKVLVIFFLKLNVIKPKNSLSQNNIRLKVFIVKTNKKIVKNSISKKFFIH